MTGVRVGWKEERGFGFIRPDAGGGDVFVHRRNIVNALWLKQGQRVTFELVDDARSRKRRAFSFAVLDERKHALCSDCEADIDHVDSDGLQDVCLIGASGGRERQ